MIPLTFTATIPAGQTAAEPVDFVDYVPVRVSVPAGFTGTGLTLSGVIPLTVAAGTDTLIPFSDAVSLRYVTAVAGTAQAADAVLTFTAIPR